MEITIRHFDGKWPSFDIMLHGTKGAEPFLTIKGCCIVQGSNGSFVSYPARKDDKGKYWNHVYGGDKFNEHVIKLASIEQAPVRKPAKQDDEDIPF